jgi:dihydroorotate dehydrogenase
MYRFLIRPVLFLFPPETIHRFLVNFIQVIFRIPFVSALISRIYHIRHVALETEFLGLRFRNPVGLAAGFDKNAEVFREFCAFGFSFIEVGTITPRGQFGNPRPRSFRLPEDSALINRMGFNNEGAEAAASKLSVKRPKGLILGGNIGKNTLTPNGQAAADFEAVFRQIHDHVDYFVVNVSCPNISDMHKLQDQEALEEILGRLTSLRKELGSSKPILLKISPDLNSNQLDETLEIIARMKIDGIVATNTTLSRQGLQTPETRVKAIGSGGLSGAPLTSRSLEVVSYISVKTGGKLPIIAVGGIMCVADAMNVLAAGATLLQIYTGFIYEGPGLARKINREILKQRLKSGDH